MRSTILFLVGIGLALPSLCRAGDLAGHELLVATFRTGDTEIFIVDPDSGDARNLTRSP